MEIIIPLWADLPIWFKVYIIIALVGLFSGVTRR